MFFNNAGKVIYYLILIIPIIVTSAVYYSVQYISSDYVYLNKISLICACLVFTVLFMIFTNIIIEKLYYQQIKGMKVDLQSIQIDAIELSDNETTSVIGSYILPLCSPLFVENYASIDFFYECLLYILITVLYLSMLNTVKPNPGFVLLGYHFYNIDIKNGMKGCLLMSKSNVRNIAQVNKVSQVFPYCYLHIDR